MSKHHLTGGCHCGNVSMEIELTMAPGYCSPRACDCDFCLSHGAAYISDRDGSLTVTVGEDTDLGRYKMGSGNADFLFCRACGVFLAVCYENDGRLFAAVNRRAVDKDIVFGDDQVVSPRLLSPSDKIQRWQDLWFSMVRIKSC